MAKKKVIGIICYDMEDSHDYIKKNKLKEWFCFWGDVDDLVFPPYVTEIVETESAHKNPNYEGIKEKLNRVLITI